MTDLAKENKDIFINEYVKNLMKSKCARLFSMSVLTWSL